MRPPSAAASARHSRTCSSASTIASSRSTPSYSTHLLRATWNDGRKQMSFPFWFFTLSDVLAWDWLGKIIQVLVSCVLCTCSRKQACNANVFFGKNICCVLIKICTKFRSNSSLVALFTRLTSNNDKEQYVEHSF